ncbi:hypothetical protein M5689_001744 [Euphorbia peplus]|nr:hypothetical protein M5689_001744 [Euphorbia peplus]
MQGVKIAEHRGLNLWLLTDKAKEPDRISQQNPKSLYRVRRSRRRRHVALGSSSFCCGCRWPVVNLTLMDLPGLIKVCCR